MKAAAERLEEKKKHYEKMPMYWSSAGFSEHRSGAVRQDKIIVEEFSKLPLRVVFLREEDKISATSHDERFPDRNWQDLVYIVDVDVICLAGKPNLYHVTRMYPEYTYDPLDDEQETE